MKILPKSLFLSLIAFCSLFSFPSGTVKNLISEPLEGATVCFGQECVQTDENGDFAFGAVSMDRPFRDNQAFSCRVSNKGNAFSVAISLRHGRRVTMALYDISGKLCANLQDRQLGKGDHNYQSPPLGTLMSASGLYMLSVTIGAQRYRFGLQHIDGRFFLQRSNVRHGESKPAPRVASTAQNPQLTISGNTFSSDTFAVTNPDSHIDITVNEYIVPTEDDLRILFSAEKEFAVPFRFGRFFTNDGGVLLIAADNNTEYFLRKGDSLLISASSFFGPYSYPNDYIPLSFLRGGVVDGHFAHHQLQEHLSSNGTLEDMIERFNELPKTDKNDIVQAWKKSYEYVNGEKVFHHYANVNFNFNSERQIALSNPFIRPQTFERFGTSREDRIDIVKSFLKDNDVDKNPFGDGYVCQHYTRDLAVSAISADIPMYQVDIEGHSFNAVLVGDNVTKYDDWLFIEPQTDEFRNTGKGDFSILIQAENPRMPNGMLLVRGTNKKVETVNDYFKSSFGIETAQTYDSSVDMQHIIDTKVKPKMDWIIE